MQISPDFRRDRKRRLSIVSSFLFFQQLFRGFSDFDVRHNLVGSYLWEIPDPKSTEKLAKWATDGWQAEGIFRVSSGLPFSVTIGGDSLGLKNNSPFNFPDRVNSPECANAVNPGNPVHYIKTQCFVSPTPSMRFGNGDSEAVHRPREKYLPPAMAAYETTIGGPTTPVTQYFYASREGSLHSRGSARPTSIV